MVIVLMFLSFKTFHLEWSLRQPNQG